MRTKENSRYYENVSRIVGDVKPTVHRAFLNDTYKAPLPL